jgi:hypothetical protein
MTPDPLIEKLAELEHEQWSHWTRHLLDNLTPENIARWRRQTTTPYADLSEAEKEKDREWARRVLACMRHTSHEDGAWPAADPT